MKILVTGGMGYIGSHTIVDLVNKGFEVISIDNFINSNENVMDRITSILGHEIKNYPIDLCDKLAIRQVFEKNTDIVGIIHFAALKSVSESIEKPLMYFQNNLVSLINILELASEYSIKNIIFSSSCTVYGQPEVLPVTEYSTWKEAESPYGRSKQLCEKILLDSYKSLNINCISLRYFNPGGAHPSIKLGEDPKVFALNLIPAITETGTGKRTLLKVFGTDYDTRDGSCIRDFIHICDLADAHTLAMQYLLKDTSTQALYETFNLGIGQGISVKEAIFAFEKVTKTKLNVLYCDRRQGDVVSIYADYSKAKNLLSWQPKYNIEDIMDTAYRWELVRT